MGILRRLLRTYTLDLGFACMRVQVTAFMIRRTTVRGPTDEINDDCQLGELTVMEPDEHDRRSFLRG